MGWTEVDVFTPLSGGVIFETGANPLSFLARGGRGYLIPWYRVLSYTMSKKHAKLKSLSMHTHAVKRMLLLALAVQCFQLRLAVLTGKCVRRQQSIVSHPLMHGMHLLDFTCTWSWSACFFRGGNLGRTGASSPKFWVRDNLLYAPIFDSKVCNF